jgi:hypothetical protein
LRQSHCVFQAGHELMILVPQAPELLE